MKDFDTFKKFPMNVGDLGKIIVAIGFEKLPKSNKSPNLVTLDTTDLFTAKHDRLLLYSLH